MKRFISLAIVLALVVSLAVMPVAAASFTEAMGEGNRFYTAVKYMEDNGIFQESDLNGSDANAWLQGDATRIEYATWLARFAGAELNVPAAQAEAETHVLDATNDLAAIAAGDKADGETETVADYFTVHYGAKTKIDSSKKDFEDGYSATQRLNFQGKTVFGDTVSYAVSFTTSAAATVKIWWVSGGDGRQFHLFDANGTELSATADESVKNSLYISELSVDAAGTYYLGLVEGSNYLFKLEVAEEAASAGSDLIFPDMEEYVGTEAYAAVEWGVANGYINGYKDGTFRPDREISREEMCALIARYFRANKWNGLKATENITLFVDQDEFSAYTTSEQNVVDCVKYGLITGRECGRFDAKHWENGEEVYTSRQQVAAIFYRASGNPLYTTKLYGELMLDGGKFTARVNEHYTAVLTFPAGAVSMDKVTVKGEVGPLPSIGLDSKHTASKTVSTGINETLELANFLENCYSFAGATVNVDIAGNTFTYDVWPAETDENGNTTVVFMCQNACDARTAWNTLADVASLHSNEDGAYAILTSGSSIRVGEAVAEFNRGETDWVVEKYEGTDALWTQFEQKINIDTDAGAEGIEVVLEKGITGAFGSRAVTLDEDVVVTVEGFSAYDLGEALRALTDREADLTQAGMDLIDAIDALFGEMSGATIDVTIEIG